MSENIIDFSQFHEGHKNRKFSEWIFDEAIKQNMDIPEIITACMYLVHTLCIVRPEYIEPTQRVANEVVGK